MNWFRCFLLFLFAHTLTFGMQTSSVDSLDQGLKKTSDIQNEINDLNKLGKDLRYSNIDSANYYSQQALELSNINNYEYGLMVSHYHLGIINRIRGNYDKTLSHYYESLALSEKLNDNYYNMALLNAIGVVHKIYGENELALKYFNQCLNQIVGFHSEEALGSIKNNIGEVYLALNEYDSALKYGLASLQARTKVNDIEGQVKTLNNLGKIYVQQEDFDSAKYYLRIALDLSVRNNNLLGQTETQISISKVHLKSGDYDESLIHAFKAMTLAEKLNAKFERLEVYKILSEVYAAKLDYPKAYKYQKSVLTLGDSVFNEEKEKEINLLKLNREEAENELLKNKNELQQVTIQKQKVLNVSIIAILVIVFILGMVLLYLLIMKRKTNASLATKALELQSANIIKSKMLSIVSHDIRGPLNNLHSLINLVKSGQISESEFQKWIGDLSGQVSITRDFLDGLLNWARYQISNDLVKAEVVDIKPLVEGVIEILQPQIEKKSIAIYNFIEAGISIKGDKEVIVLVFKNLLSNAIKFSHQNGQIEITSSVKQHFVEVSISDHGVGIDENKMGKLFDFESHYSTKGTSGEAGTGLGLAFCKEFIELNGGEIRVESKINEGTTFHLSIPLAD